MSSNRKNISVLDIEASGIGSHSYPIEVGITLSSGETYSRLIKPIDSWTHWELQAELLHRISREQLLSNGVSLTQVCHELNELCENRILYSDAWVHDSSWLNKLFGFAGILPKFSISPIETLLGDGWTANKWLNVKKQVIQRLGIRPHRALSDALVISEAYKEYLSETEKTNEPPNLFPQHMLVF